MLGPFQRTLLTQMQKEKSGDSSCLNSRHGCGAIVKRNAGFRTVGLFKAQRIIGLLRRYPWLPVLEKAWQTRGIKKAV